MVLSIFISTSFVHAGVISKTVKVGVADVVIKKVAQKGIEKGVDKYGKVLAAEIAARQVAEQNANNNNKSKGSSDNIASSAGQQAAASAGGSGKKNNDDDDNDEFTKARGEKVDAGKQGSIKLTDEIKQIIKNAESISTAKAGQYTAPRNLNEQIMWKQVVENPSEGRALGGLNNDPRFPTKAGFQKMVANHELSDGTKIEIHYQHNTITNKAYDIKIVTH
jgi:hypothetical protein